MSIKEEEYGSGVGGSYTHLLPGLNWNYNYITEPSTRIANCRLAEQKSHSQGFTEEATPRLVGRVCTDV